MAEKLQPALPVCQNPKPTRPHQLVDSRWGGVADGRVAGEELRHDRYGAAVALLCEHEGDIETDDACPVKCQSSTADVGTEVQNVPEDDNAFPRIA